MVQGGRGEKTERVSIAATRKFSSSHEDLAPNSMRGWIDDMQKKAR